MPQRYNLMANLTNYKDEIIFIFLSVGNLSADCQAKERHREICSALIIDKVKP